MRAWTSNLFADRRVVAVIAFVFIAVVAEFLVIRHIISNDRAAIEQQFANDRLTQLQYAIGKVEEDLSDVTDDLRVAGQLAMTGGTLAQRRERVRTVLRGVKHYRGMIVTTADGARLLDVVNPRSGGEPLPKSVQDALEHTAMKALQDGVNEVVVSEPLDSMNDSGDVDELRVFAKMVPTNGSEPPTAVAMLVDTRAIFAPLRLISSDEHTSLLVVGPDGASTPLTQPELRDALASRETQLTQLLDPLRSGQRGNIRLTAKTADDLGLGHAAVIASYAPMYAVGEYPDIRPDIARSGPARWSVATLTSMSTLRARDGQIVWRLSIMSGAFAVLLVGFASYFVVASRRQATLEERLAHAQEVAGLESQLLRVEKMATVGVLAAGIAHEIGTPLGVIRGRAEYVGNKLDDGDPNAKSLRIIIEQIDRVSRVIRGLLDFSREQPSMVTSTALETVVDEVLELLRYEFEGQDLQLEVELSDVLPNLAADPDGLQQVLINLLVNAADATSKGGRITLTAQLDTQPRADRRSDVLITIADTGRGIPEGKIHQIFDPFYTTKKRGQGTGLGLPIVAKIIRSHGGEIDVESREGKGTRFIIRWPTTQSQQQGGS